MPETRNPAPHPPRSSATISEFGPVLFSRILGLNDTQGGVVSVVFKYCDDRDLPLLDLKDFKKVLQYLGNEGKAEIEAEYGQFSSATAGTTGTEPFQQIDYTNWTYISGRCFQTPAACSSA